MIHAARRKRFSSFWILVGTFGLVAVCLGVWGGMAGCKKKKKQPQKPTKVIKIDWDRKWKRVRADGEEGKFHIKQGLGIVQGATDEAGRREGYEQMVKGYNLIQDAIERGDNLKDTVEEKEPGRHFPEWEDDLSGWGEELVKVRKNVPLEYIDKMNK
ncbi:MAG: hypothetical protein ACYTHM_18490 [Planctomycetota bacterium]|jgi:hypothetical protein